MAPEGVSLFERHPPHFSTAVYNQSLNMAKIAVREAFSRARVPQIMNLLELPQEVQVDLINPPAPLKITQFSERKLRSLIALADTVKQMVAWRSWTAELLNKVTE